MEQRKRFDAGTHLVWLATASRMIKEFQNHLRQKLKCLRVDFFWGGGYFLQMVENFQHAS